MALPEPRRRPARGAEAAEPLEPPEPPGAGSPEVDVHGSSKPGSPFVVPGLRRRAYLKFLSFSDAPLEAHGGRKFEVPFLGLLWILVIYGTEP